MKQTIIEILNSFFDLKYFLKYSFKVKKLSQKEHYIAFLTKQYHTVEKGLALPNPRLGFGEIKINDLLELTPEYISKFGEDELTKNIASVLYQYIKFHKRKQFNSDLINRVEVFLRDKNNSKSTGGVREFVYPKITNTDFDLFIKGRASVRNFKEIEVSNDLVLEAIEMAKYTPSVCNRQGWKVHIYKGDEAKKMIHLQNGSGGFRNVVKTVAIITGDQKYFSSNERNQVGIDSGMFCMSFILSLYSLGIGSCALNTCVSIKSELRIKRAGNIPDNEKVIMYIALGYPVDNCVVAKSLRRNNEDFVTFH